MTCHIGETLFLNVKEDKRERHSGNQKLSFTGYALQIKLLGNEIKLTKEH